MSVLEQNNDWQSFIQVANDYDNKPRHWFSNKNKASDVIEDEVILAAIENQLTQHDKRYLIVRFFLSIFTDIEKKREQWVYSQLFSFKKTLTLWISNDHLAVNELSQHKEKLTLQLGRLITHVPRLWFWSGVKIMIGKALPGFLNQNILNITQELDTIHRISPSTGSNTEKSSPSLSFCTPNPLDLVESFRREVNLLISQNASQHSSQTTLQLVNLFESYKAQCSHGDIEELEQILKQSTASLGFNSSVNEEDEDDSWLYKEIEALNNLNIIPIFTPTNENTAKKKDFPLFAAEEELEAFRQFLSGCKQKWSECVESNREQVKENLSKKIAPEFKRLAKKYHPDRNIGHEETVKPIFQAISKELENAKIFLECLPAESSFSNLYDELIGSFQQLLRTKDKVLASQDRLLSTQGRLLSTQDRLLSTYNESLVIRNKLIKSLDKLIEVMQEKVVQQEKNAQAQSSSFAKVKKDPPNEKFLLEQLIQKINAKIASAPRSIQSKLNKVIQVRISGLPQIIENTLEELARRQQVNLEEVRSSYVPVVFMCAEVRILEDISLIIKQMEHAALVKASSDSHSIRISSGLTHSSSSPEVIISH